MEFSKCKIQKTKHQNRAGTSKKNRTNEKKKKKRVFETEKKMKKQTNKVYSVAFV